MRLNYQKNPLILPNYQLPTLSFAHIISTNAIIRPNHQCNMCVKLIAYHYTSSRAGASSGPSAVVCSSSGSANLPDLPGLLDRDLRSSSSAIRSRRAPLFLPAAPSPPPPADPRRLMCTALASPVSAPPTHALMMPWRTAPISRASRHMLTARCWPVKKATAMRAYRPSVIRSCGVVWKKCENSQPPSAGSHSCARIRRIPAARAARTWSASLLPAEPNHVSWLGLGT